MPEGAPMAAGRERTMDAVLGIDTSNYRTSIAAVTLDGRILSDQRKLLPVENGQRGLRQSEAVYLHLKQMKEMDRELRRNLEGHRIAAVAASRRPRDREDSYMPVFEAGETAGRMIAAACGVPYYATDHQHGHLRAAIRGTPLEGSENYLAIHLSGGTTDLMAIRDGKVIPLGTSLDLHIGQLVDRAGVAMGLDFPAGAELEQLARGGSAEAALPCSMERGDLCCHFSGAESRVLGWIRDGKKPFADIAREIYDLMARTVARMLAAGRRETGLEATLLCGGVASSEMFRGMLEERNRKNRNGPELICFGRPELSGDNAVGVALIGADRLRQSDAAR